MGEVIGKLSRGYIYVYRSSGQRGVGSGEVDMAVIRDRMAIDSGLRRGALFRLDVGALWR